MSDKRLLAAHWVLLVAGFLLILAALWVWSPALLVAGLVLVVGSWLVGRVPAVPGRSAMRRFLRRRHRPVIAVVMLGLTVNAWVQAGMFAVLVVLVAAAAVLVIVAFEFLFTGASAAHHSMQMEKAIKAIEADRRKTITRRELTR